MNGADIDSNYRSSRKRVVNGNKIKIIEGKSPRNLVPPPIASNYESIEQLVRISKNWSQCRCYG